MPYVITTEAPATLPNPDWTTREGTVVVHRFAATTLSEAAAHVLRAAPVDLLNVFATDRTLTDQYAALTEIGGQVGPFTDGTTITVERVAQ